MTQQTYVALLRGINIVGRNRVPMAGLRDFAAHLGFGNARTLLNSGNLVFGAERRKPADFERLFEAEAATHLGVAVDFFVRTVAEWTSVIAGNPFPAEAKRDPSHLLVMFLKAAPAAANVKALQAAIVGREVVHADERHAYIVYPDGIGRSRLTSNLIEKKLGTRGTGRNWNT
ncbi:MAG: hypothetical protein QOE68_3060, partial [Thermoanaerobaculia bacterium]|nr:hypothetical protein [Thermoanaerobaculia bacterium]